MWLRAFGTIFLCISFLGFLFSSALANVDKVSVDEVVDCHFAYIYGRDLGIVDSEESVQMTTFWGKYFASLNVPPSKGVLREKLLSLLDDREEFKRVFIAQLDICDEKRLEIIERSRVAE